MNKTLIIDLSVENTEYSLQIDVEKHGWTIIFTNGKNKRR